MKQVEEKMVSSCKVTYPSVRLKKLSGDVKFQKLRYSTCYNQSKGSIPFGARKCYAPCMLCGKMVLVKALQCKALLKGKYVEVHPKPACDSWKKQHPEQVEEVQNELEILKQNFDK